MPVTKQPHPILLLYFYLCRQGEVPRVEQLAQAVSSEGMKSARCLLRGGVFANLAIACYVAAATKSGSLQMLDVLDMHLATKGASRLQPSSVPTPCLLAL